VTDRLPVCPWCDGYGDVVRYTPNFEYVDCPKCHGSGVAGFAPCAPGSHLGPILPDPRFEAAGGIWAEQGMCQTCLSHTHFSTQRKVAA
jgi:hypothetical protein